MLNLSFWLYIFHGWPRQPFDWKVFQMKNNKTKLWATEYASESDKLALMRCKSIKRIVCVRLLCQMQIHELDFTSTHQRCAHILLYGFLLYRILDIGQKDCQWIPIIGWKICFFSFNFGSFSKEFLGYLV